MPKLQPLEINERKISYISYKIYKNQAKLITCNLNRYECKQIKNFLASINTETKCCTWQFFHQ